MSYQTIGEVYEANDKIRAELIKTVENLSDEQANALTEDGKWTIAKIVEHLSAVENSMMRISAKLLSKAQADGKQADGAFRFSEGFLQKSAHSHEEKYTAPDFVQPQGVQTIAESLAKLEENRLKLNELRPLFESVDCAGYTFPHPSFGDMTAHDWLALIGGHEARHIRQIKKILS